MGSFNSAFAAARKSGKSTFNWNGKSYNTKLKDPMNDTVQVIPRSRDDAVKSMSKKPSFSGATDVGNSLLKAKATGRRSPYAVTQDRGASGVAGTQSKKPAGPSFRAKGRAPKEDNNSFSANLKGARKGLSKFLGTDKQPSFRDAMKKVSTSIKMGY